MGLGSYGVERSTRGLGVTTWELGELVRELIDYEIEMAQMDGEGWRWTSMEGNWPPP